MNCLLFYYSISTRGTIKTNIYLSRFIQGLHNGVNVHVRLNVRHKFAILIHAVIDHCSKNWLVEASTRNMKYGLTSKLAQNLVVL